MSQQVMVRHASQAIHWRVIGSFGDGVKYYFSAKNRITSFLQCVTNTVIFYHIFFHCFLGFYHPSPIAFANRVLHAGLRFGFVARIHSEGLIAMMASLAALAKACKNVIEINK
jgi:hypothetical protein